MVPATMSVLVLSHALSIIIYRKASSLLTHCQYPGLPIKDMGRPGYETVQLGN